MKKKNIFKKLLLGIGLLTITASVSAQEFPEFELVDPQGTPLVFRGNAAWGDYNNDGKMDLISIGREITNDGWFFYLTLFKNNGSGFDLTHEIGIPYNEIYNAVLTWIDYNNDGNLDLLYMGTTVDDNTTTPNNSSSVLFVKLYKNSGSAGGYTFSEVSDTNLTALLVEQEGAYASAVTIGDFDNDGYQDILMTGSSDDVRHVYLYKNDGGTGSFTLQTTPYDGTRNFDEQNAGSVAFADFNNDGYLDIIVNGWNTAANDGIVRMYLNNGDGTFRSNLVEGDISQETSKGQIGVADLNNDGYLDFILTGERMNGGNWTKVTALYLFKQEDQGYLLYDELTADAAWMDNLQKGSVDFADFNNDGKLDVFVTGEGAGPRSTVFLKNDDMTYEASANGIAGLVRSGSIGSLADYDNDGYLDVVTMGYSDEVGGVRGRFFNIYKNKGNLSLNTPPVAPSNLQSSYADGKMTFTWNAGSDSETPAAALRYNFCLKKSNGEIYTLIPADVETGYIKTANITPALTTASYVMEIPDGTYEWGVQTIDQNKKGSAFAMFGQSSVKDTYAGKVNAYVLNGEIVVVSEDGAAFVSVYDAAGKLIAAKANVVNEPVAAVTDGVYFVKIQTANGAVTKKATR